MTNESQLPYTVAKAYEDIASGRESRRRREAREQAYDLRYAGTDFDREFLEPRDVRTQEDKDEGWRELPRYMTRAENERFANAEIKSAPDGTKLYRFPRPD